MTLGEMKRRYSSGQSSAHIGRVAGVHQCTVLRRLRATGVQCRTASGADLAAVTRFHSSMPTVLELFADDVSQSEIARRFGVSRPTVHRALRAAGVIPGGGRV